MKLKHRKILCKLLDYCSELGHDLDGTATHPEKYRDRQRAHAFTVKVLYAVLSEHRDNEYTDHDFEQAFEALDQLKSLTKKEYPDRNGIYSLTPSPTT